MFDLRYLGKFTRLSVLVLAIEWTVFGSMHFSMTKETVEMLPNFLYPIGIPIVVITGILEVATGILILIPEVRRRAAMGSIALLILLLPAMYAILANQSGDASAFETAFRVLLMPNNIFLAICSVHLLREPPGTRAAAIAETPLPPRRRPDNGLTMVIVPAILLVANCAGFLAIWVGARGHFDIAGLWAMACLASGALIGFLFAVPRINPNAKLTSRLMPNTNVELVSDWLTKICRGRAGEFRRDRRLCRCARGRARRGDRSAQAVRHRADRLFLRRGDHRGLYPYTPLPIHAVSRARLSRPPGRLIGCVTSP